LGHLDLDLELDDEYTIVPQASNQYQAAPRPYENTEASRAHPIPASKTHDTPFIPNGHQPLFFPVTSSTLTAVRPRSKDPFTTAQANGWNWRDANVGFYKTQTDEEIREKWEEVKGDLTRGWKRRWRDAVKVRKRRGGDEE
jgi:hypothetical protein